MLVQFKSPSLRAASLGRRPTYATQAEADAFDRGFRHYPKPIDGAWNSAMQDGWYAAEAAKTGSGIERRADGRMLSWD
jgi:hypothetical protein